MMSVTQSDIKAMVQEVVEAVMEKRDGLKKALDNQEPHAAHVQHCPDCYKDIIEGMNRTSAVFCADCGLPLGSSEFVSKLESCPNCHKQRYRKR